MALFAVMLCGALVLRPMPLHACSCEGQDFRVVPIEELPVPTNTIVWVTFWIGRVTPDEPAFEIHELGKKGEPAENPRPVAAETRIISAGRQRTVTLRPRAPLEMETRYEVRVARADGSPRVIRSFTTGTTPDDTPPTWAGVGKSILARGKRQCCDCVTGDPFAEIELHPHEKVGDIESRLRGTFFFGVWPETFDPTLAPLTFARGAYGKVRLGNETIRQGFFFFSPLEWGR